MFSKLLQSSTSSAAVTGTAAPEAIRTLFAARNYYRTILSSSQTQISSLSHGRSFSSVNAQKEDNPFDNPFSSLDSVDSMPFTPYKADEYNTPRFSRPENNFQDQMGQRMGGGRDRSMGHQRQGLSNDQSNEDLGDPDSSASLLGEKTDVSKPPVLDEDGNISLNPDHFPMCSEIRETIKSAYKIEKFYPVQANCFHPIANGKDVVGRSHTGTGKTLAFVLPIVQRLINLNVAPRQGEGTILVIEPTRELANQVATEIRKLSSKVRVVTVFGGVSYDNQRRMLAHGVDIVVGTPGRLMDLINQGYASFQSSHAIVLDEADEMLRMGFRQQIEDILRGTRPGRQVLLFSATLPSWVKDVSRNHLKNPLVIDMVKGGDDTPSTIQHYAIASKPHFERRVPVLRELIKHTKGRVIVFVNRKSDADMFADAQLGVRAGALHGDLSQNQRDRVMKDFRSGISKVLFATDIAARGLDIPNVDLVIQLDLPQQTEFYVHRSGRTGRAGKLGRSVMIYSPQNRSEIVSLSREIHTQFRFIPPPPIDGIPCSMLNGERGMISVKVTGNRNGRELEDQIRKLVPQFTQSLFPEFIVNGMVLDIPISIYQTIMKAQAETGNTAFANMSKLTEFPVELLKGDFAYRGGRSGGGGGGARRFTPPGFDSNRSGDRGGQSRGGYNQSVRPPPPRSMGGGMDRGFDRGFSDDFDRRSLRSERY